MKWFILLLFVLALIAGYSPQLRTRYYALPVVVRRWQAAIIFPRMAIKVDIVRS